MSIITAAEQALITSKCSCTHIGANLEHGEFFKCSKCGAKWYARYCGCSSILTLKGD